jgi:hypothetical protein
MNRSISAVVAGLVWLVPLAMTGDAQAPTVAIPKPGVPEILTMEGKFIRVAYNNEGYVILGYQPANRSVGGDWMRDTIGYFPPKASTACRLGFRAASRTANTG